MAPKRKPNKSAARSRPAAATADDPVEPTQTTETQSQPAPPPPPPPPVAIAVASSEAPLFLPGFDSSSSDGEGNIKGKNKNSPEKPPPPPSQLAPTTTTTIPDPTPAPRPRAQDDDASSGDESCTDDDPVVRTYDVHITSRVPRDLYIFQYPVRPRDQPYTRSRNACPIEARLKPRSGLVEVDVPVNVAVNYDEEKGRTWGDVVWRAAREAGKGSGGSGSAGPGGGGKRRRVGDAEKEDEDVMYMDLAAAVKAGRVLDRQTLGSKVQADGTKYMAGVFKNDKLYLTPITSTLQLRPQFHYVDTQLDQERAANKALHPPKQEARAIQLSVKSAEDPSSQLSGTMKALRVAEEESWVKLHWVDQDTDDAWGVYEDVCLGGVVGKGKGKEGEEGEEGEEGKERKEGKEAEVLSCVTTKREYMEWLSAGKPIVKREAGVGK